jgi:hypothetical protein
MAWRTRDDLKDSGCMLEKDVVDWDLICPKEDAAERALPQEETTRLH